MVRMAAVAKSLGLALVAVVAVSTAASGCVNAEDRACARGNTLLRRGDVAGALASYRQAVRIAPSARSQTLLGHALFEAQRYDEAERAYRAAIAAGEPTGEAERALALVEARRGRSGEAEATLYARVGRAPGDLDARLALAAMRLARADLGTAASSFDAVLARRPTHVAALYGRARLALRRGDYDAADAGFATLEDEVPGRAYGAYGRALVAARRGQPQAACEALERAVRLGLGSSDARRMQLDREGHPLRATPCYRQILARVRGHA